MDKQAVLMLALATLFVAGLVVGVCGWMLFSRTKPSQVDPATTDAAEAAESVEAAESHPEPDSL